jgi:hypothetical protein
MGWGPASQQAARRAALEPQGEQEAQRKAERDRRAVERARALRTLVQSPDWWAVETIFTENFDDLLDSLLGADDLTADEMLARVGGLKMARALYESLDAALGAGHRAFERLTGGGRLLNLAAAKADRPIEVAKQPLT